MYIGVDLGGTNIVAGVVDSTGKILAKEKCSTNHHRGARAVIEDIARLSKEVCASAKIPESEIEWIGIGAPGSIDRENGVVIYNNNLNFENVQVKAIIQETWPKMPVFLENDANAAAFGEVMAGSAKDYSSSLFVTLGTGVGGGIVFGSKILTGYNGGAGEIGHIVMVENGRPCTCGRKGCWEAYASATALIDFTKEAMEANKDSGMWKIAETLEAADGRTAFDAMRAGDKVGTEVVNKYIGHLACGLTSLVNILQPEVVCIGGGIAAEKETLLAPLREYVYREAYKCGDKRTSIITATLGNDAGVIGAAMLGIQK